MIAKFNIKWNFAGAIIFIVLFVMSLVVNIVYINRQDKFGTIDIQKIITHEAQKLASIYPKGDVPTEKLRGLIDSIQDNIQRVSHDKKIILLSRTVVLSGNVPDYTESFIKELGNESFEQIQ